MASWSCWIEAEAELIHRDVSFPSMLVKDSYGCEVFCRVAALELLQSEDTGVVSFGDVFHVLYRGDSGKSDDPFFKSLPAAA